MYRLRPSLPQTIVFYVPNREWPTRWSKTFHVVWKNSTICSGSNKCSIFSRLLLRGTTLLTRFLDHFNLTKIWSVSTKKVRLKYGSMKICRWINPANLHDIRPLNRMIWTWLRKKLRNAWINWSESLRRHRLNRFLLSLKKSADRLWPTFKLSIWYPIFAKSTKFNYLIKLSFLKSTRDNPHNLHKFDSSENKLLFKISIRIVSKLRTWTFQE